MRDAWKRVILAVLGILMLGAGAGAGSLGAQAFAPPQGAREMREGRFLVYFFPAEERLARSLIRDAGMRDTFPGLPRMRDTVRILLAPDEGTFRRWVGDGAPEWGGAFAFPAERLIVMQGVNTVGAAGDPIVTLRHELAHLALGEWLGDRVPRWFDEGYASFAAGEWGRDEVIATSFGLVWRGLPTLNGLDSLFYAGPERAGRGYALAHRAVAELSAMGEDRGLSLLLEHWRTEGTFERAVRQAYGITGDDFEKRWRSAVRRQYGVLALLADLSMVSVFMVFFLGPLWWQRRKQLKARLARMREADAIQDATERASALAALLGEGPDGPRDGAPPRSPPPPASPGGAVD